MKAGINAYKDGSFYQGSCLSMIKDFWQDMNLGE